MEDVSDSIVSLSLKKLKEQGLLKCQTFDVRGIIIFIPNTFRDYDLSTHVLKIVITIFISFRSNSNNSKKYNQRLKEELFFSVLGIKPPL